MERLFCKKMPEAFAESRGVFGVRWNDLLGELGHKL